MTIEAKVVGVRLYPQSKSSTRRITLEWSDPERKPTDEDPFPVSYTHVLELNDDIKEFDLGDVVNIELTLAVQQQKEPPFEGAGCPVSEDLR